MTDAVPALIWEDAGTDEPGDQNADSTTRVAPGATSAYYSLGPTATGEWGLELCQIAHGEEIGAGHLGDFRSAVVAKDFATWWENNGHVILASEQPL